MQLDLHIHSRKIRPQLLNALFIMMHGPNVKPNYDKGCLCFPVAEVISYHHILPLKVLVLVEKISVVQAPAMALCLLEASQNLADLKTSAALVNGFELMVAPHSGKTLKLIMI